MIKKLIWLPVLLAACLSQASRAFELFGPKASVQSVDRNPGYSGQVKPIEEPFLEALQRLAGHDPTRDHLGALLSEQESYDYNAHLQTTDLLHRSGFEFELHNSTSLDGYITQLVRIVNPKAKRSELKQPPVVLYAGQGASPAVFLMTAIGRGHPLEWPREDQWASSQVDGNRSLALTLANHGYDVWLVPARGVDEANRARERRVRASQLKDLFAGFGAAKKTNASSAAPFSADSLKSWVRDLDAAHYWSFSDDEIIKFEFGIQLDLVLELTGYERVSLISYSNGGFISFGFMAYEPDFAHRHLDTIISIAPAVFIDRFNVVLGAGGLLSKLGSASQPFPDTRIDTMARVGFSHLCRPKTLRYSICKLLLNQLYGHSDLFSTHLELAIIDYMGRPVSVRGLRQTLQVAHSGQLRAYDFGPFGNLVEYEQPRAPVYDLAAVRHERMFIISGSKDAIVSDRSITKLISELHHKPDKWIHIPGYNHLDLLAGHDNAQRVNLPILQILDDRDLEANYYREDEEEAEEEEKGRDSSQEQSVGYFPNSGARSANRTPLRLMGYQSGASAHKLSKYDDQAQLGQRKPKVPLPRLKHYSQHQPRRPGGLARQPSQTDYSMRPAVRV